MRLDHLAIVGADLADAAAWAEARLGVPLRPGGRHARFATWNRLVRLGPGEYLEIIAPDPEAPDPGRPRWFGLSAPPAAPRLGNWICAVPDIAEALVPLPEAGPALDLARDDLRWRIGVPEDGSLPAEGGLPTLIEWQSGTHPAERLPDDGLSLAALEVRHPEARALADRLAGRLADPRVRFIVAPAPSLSARLSTPAGEVVL
ncbi:VOC family protein [Wenxinia marina]|uniref:Wenxma_12, whole genome shotgun sequence n=1 Tax=Wenxinia marina DSM 24838 TaxID=1123501 RepID=A0A0D0Q2D7_9RHOB|nr:VOC family protein [Wenxinia marina]KIQ68674.1 Glyoxalase-like domain protein [Wenxinia marina DSM 24838]GGL67846.1 polyphosphate kinase [Wenxinia marina]